MDTGHHAHPSKPRNQSYANTKKAASWLGHVIVAQVIAYFVRNWLP